MNNDNQDVVRQSEVNEDIQSLHELDFDQMIERGLMDARASRVHTNEEVKRLMESWHDSA
jgi:hypothetical protein